MNKSISLTKLKRKTYQVEFYPHYEYLINIRKDLVNGSLDVLANFEIIWFWSNLPKDTHPHTYIKMLGETTKLLRLDNENYEKIPFSVLMKTLYTLYR